MKKSSLFNTIAIVIMFVAPLLSYAIAHEKLTSERKETNKEIKDKRDQLRQEVRDKRDSLKQQLERGRTDLRGMKNGTATATLREAHDKFVQDVMQKRDALHNELKEKRMQFQDFAKERKDALKKKFGESKSARIEEFFGKMLEKFDHAIARLKDLSDRIEKRLDEAAGRGKDVTHAREILKNANDKINSAERTLEDAKTKYTDATKDKDFRTAFAGVRELVHGVTESIKSAHRALVEAIGALKGIGNKDARDTETSEGNASSTPQ